MSLGEKDKEEGGAKYDLEFLWLSTWRERGWLTKMQSTGEGTDWEWDPRSKFGFGHVKIDIPMG